MLVYCLWRVRSYTAYDSEQGVEVAWHEVGEGSGPDRPKNNFYEFQHEHLMNVIDSWKEGDRVIYITEILTAGTLEGYVSLSISIVLSTR